MGEPDGAVTVVMAPREGYWREVDCVRRLRDGSEPIEQVIVVHEARCPARTERAIGRLARDPRIDVVHLPGRVGANGCRAAGFERATTPYVLFLDNDAHLEPGSVAPLVARARATGASFVQPLCLNGDGSVHYAGSVVRGIGVDGRRHFFEARLPSKGPAADIRPYLEAAPTDAPELHGVLVHRESLRSIGGLDVELQSSMDCLDLGLRLQDVNGGGWMEPAAGVVYHGGWPRPRHWPIFFDRWSRATVDHDIARFISSWGFHPESAPLRNHRYVIEMRRWRAFPKVRGLVRRTLGDRADARLAQVGDALMDRFSSVRRAPR